MCALRNLFGKPNPPRDYGDGADELFEGATALNCHDRLPDMNARAGQMTACASPGKVPLGLWRRLRPNISDTCSNNRDVTPSMLLLN
jgi:hypothetical protein